MATGLLGLTGCAGEHPTNLGVREDMLNSCPSSPNCVSSQATDERHRIAALEFRDKPDSAFNRLKLVLSQRSDIAIVKELPGYLQVELRTRFFIDDGEFLLDRERNIIHVRSASRLGYSDLGKNRSRLEDIRRQFLATEKKI